MVKVNVFLSDMDNFADMNSVYVQYWGDVKPCRTYVFLSTEVTYFYLDHSLTGNRCVAVKTLPLNTDVEIECIATL